MFIGNHNPPNTAKPIVTILAKALVFEYHLTKKINMPKVINRDAPNHKNIPDSNH